MILFLGCSLTWGQGLQIEKWLSEGKSIEFCNKHSVPVYNAELISYDDDEYRKSKFYPNLVAKKLNVSYSTKWTNGGKNEDMEFIIDNIDRICNSGDIELIVIQFTDITRDDFFTKYINNESNKFEFLKSYVETQIANIDFICKRYSNSKKKWIGVCWTPEHSKILKENFPDNYVPILHRNKTFDNIHDLLFDTKNLIGDDVSLTPLELCDKFKGIKDGHLTSEAHEIISKSILYKINKLNLKFTNYSEE